MDGILYIKELYVLILLKINSIEKFWSCDSSEAPLHVYWIKMLSPGRAFSCNLESQVQVQEQGTWDACLPAVLCISVFLFCPCAMCDDKKLWLFLNYFAVKRSKSGHFKHIQGQNGVILHNSIWHHSTSTEDASGCPAQNIMLMKFEHGSVLSGLGGWAAG